LADSPALDIPCLSGDTLLLDRLYSLLDDFEPLAIQDTDEGLRVFFRTAAQRDAARRALSGREALDAVSIDVGDEDWARRSQQDLRAIEAGRLVIAPPWDVPGGRPVIIIEPSTGFGTGHHATTRCACG